MPRPVVPILPVPSSLPSRACSRARSSSPWSGRIGGAFSAIRSVSTEIATPWPRRVSISRRSAQGSTTTPLPMIESLPRTTPEGSSESLYVLPSMTSVWPALWPPWKRTTTSARSDSQSTTLPLPSSPHWAPTTATFAMPRAPPAASASPAAACLLEPAAPVRQDTGLTRRREGAMAAGGDVVLLARAYAFAAARHGGHRRKGLAQEPYVNHLVEVAE